MSAAPDSKMIVWRWDPKILKKHIGHPIIVMLTSMNENLTMLFSKKERERAGLDKLRSCPDNGEKLHR